MTRRDQPENSSKSTVPGKKNKVAMIKICFKQPFLADLVTLKMFGLRVLRVSKAFICHSFMLVLKYLVYFSA